MKSVLAAAPCEYSAPVTLAGMSPCTIGVCGYISASWWNSAGVRATMTQGTPVRSIHGDHMPMWMPTLPAYGIAMRGAYASTASRTSWQPLA
jgi:hypothetical protein